VNLLALAYVTAPFLEVTPAGLVLRLLRQSLSQLYRKYFTNERRSAPRAKSQSQIVVHSNRDLLLRTEIAFGRLYRGVAEHEFDLLQICGLRNYLS
jgi:hypothetical protein